MRIPNEALPPYQRENESKAATDAKEKNAKPVGGAAKIRAALSNLLPGQRRSTTKDDDPDQGNSGASQNGRRIRERPDNPDRRREERRKANLPILLDTRATRSRRTSAKTPRINFKV